jgi:hypothetical protein
MSGYDRVGDHADRDYLCFSGDPADGAAKLATSGREFGVLVDSDGRARMLVTPAGGTVPAVAIDVAAPMERVVGPDIVALLNSGVPALVVTEDSRVAGVLRAASVIGYLVEHSPVRSGDVRDVTLQGNSPPVTPLELTCSTCGTVNAVLFFSAGDTQCSHGHPLTLTWD